MTTNRRDFLKNAAGAAAGILFTGCGTLDGGRPELQTVSPGRRQVVVSGRSVKTIDVHAHCVIPEARALMGLKMDDQRGGMVVMQDRIKEMDAQGIDVEVLSINPAWYGLKDRDLAEQVIRTQNEKLAETCAKHPDRLYAYSSVALQFPDLAVRQLEYGMKKLGLKGVAVGANVGPREFSDPAFNPFWAKCEELNAVIFIHSISPPEIAGRLKGNGWLSNVIGNPLSTTIALSHLIFEGTLDRYPGLKIISAHGGGYLPSYAPRSDHGCRVSPEFCNNAIQLKKKPTEYLRSLYFDTLVFTPEALRHIAAEVGTSQLMIGTDHPIPWQDKSVEHVLATDTLSDAEKVAILGGNAAKLFNIR